MSSGQKPAANRSTLLQFKARIVGAKKGYGLLKKKRDALKTRFQAMLHEIITCKKAVGVMVTDCAFSYAKAEYASDSEFSQAVLNRVSKPSVTVTMKAENCAGVQLPKFTMNYDPAKDGSTDSLGIGCGGQVIQSCRDQHRIALKLLIEMASLQTMFKTLDEEIKMTSRRVNSLECVVIPRLESTMQWVKGEMDEMEREEFFRVKKVVEKKKQRHAKELAAALAAAGGAQDASKQRPMMAGPGANGMGISVPMLNVAPPSFIPQKDKDILF
ncbi:unnamed protein product [Amoebophrya sp. A25]|nr:unnamed protein product [Amoebophrya sp. A25]|eukprot:GSA25T00008715001.1